MDIKKAKINTIHISDRILDLVLLFVSARLALIAERIFHGKNWDGLQPESFNFYTLIIIFVVSFNEFNLLINRAFETKYRDNKSKWIRNKNIRRTIQVLSFLYLSLFAIISWAAIDADRVYFIYILLICICSDIGGFVFRKNFWR